MSPVTRREPNLGPSSLCQHGLHIDRSLPSNPPSCQVSEDDLRNTATSPIAAEAGFYVADIHLHGLFNMIKVKPLRIA